MDLSKIAALVALALLMLVLRGFLPQMARAPDPRIRHVGWGVSYIVAAVALRGAIWDLGPLFFGAAWPGVVAWLGGVQINTAFYVPVILAAWHFLRFLHFLIPARRRRTGLYAWTIMAPFYPLGPCILRLAARQTD